ncbi:hypothetical protein EZJ49_11560 [Bdellovibrio bacteriovorus]|uniref:hypothetical protein n=1 Tax=Bdellovibrio bacteriovorus TaxID=959 RepID=UPI0021D2EEB2|nr:hypothetical protein [Bdellovibrio bacteriovorus]UXR63707.1 hypothetical protein EZJ49_11560 [Bdellovibrio bacteriovorus]
MRLYLSAFLIIWSLTSKAAETLPWWAASAEEVLQAPCKTQRPPTAEFMEQALTKLPGSSQSRVLHGISFKNENSSLLQLFADLHTYDLSLRGKPELRFTTSCTRVLCAMKELYGNSEGVQLLFLLKQFGFNGSHLRTTKASAWSASELNEILQALQDYPLHLYPVVYNKRLIHFTRGQRYSFGENIIANASMEIFDAWNELPFGERQQTLLHELGHTLAYRQRLDTSAEWLAIGGWKEVQKNFEGHNYRDYVLEKPEKAVSEYGMLNPSEDFAESVVAYRFNGRRLLAQQKEKYFFLKAKIFANQEFLSEDQCKATMQLP